MLLEKKFIGRHDVFCNFNSSSVDFCVYNNKTQNLDVLFGSGVMYRYEKVPVLVFHEFMTSESQGKFIHSDIRGKYDFKKDDVDFALLEGLVKVEIQGEKNEG